ncbi:MAG: chemotaxis protein CheA [Deltaproteobacteria bacterium]|nr:chemotaxis protein CheA [Deltaproteobacteria bacterium]
MAPSLSELQQQLLGTFLEESYEGLDNLESGLLGLESSEDGSVAINDIFRAAHSLKGGAATFGFAGLTELAHEMETVLDDVRAGKRVVTPALSSLLLQGVDGLRALLADVRQGLPADATAFAALISQLRAVSKQPKHTDAPVTSKSTVAATRAAPGTWHIKLKAAASILSSGNEPLRLFRELGSLGQLQVSCDATDVPPLSTLEPETCYLSWAMTVSGNITRGQIEDVFAWVADECQLDISSSATTKESDPSAASAAPVRVESGARNAEEPLESIRVSVGKVDQLMNMVGELVITQSMLGELEDDGPIDRARLARIREGLSLLARNTRSLQDSVMRLRSIPVSIVFARFPRLVRDTSQSLNKKVDLRLTGQTTEVDKTVLEKLSDPLVHLVRNSLDHGVEGPQERLAAGKPESGTIELRAYHRGGDIVVEVEDDGRGLSRERILDKARRVGLVADDADLDDNAVYDLIFAPGFSTAESVTDLSGRGVGMDVVRKNIRTLGGDVSVTTKPGKGTKVCLRVPLTLAIIDGQLVRLGDYHYVVPLLSIVESIQVDPKFVMRVDGRIPAYRLRDEVVRMVDLAKVLAIPVAKNEASDRLMVVVESDGEKIGLLVDELLAQQQVVVKSLETNFDHVDGVSGATVLGDGGIAFILDIVVLGRLSRRRSALGLVAA